MATEASGPPGPSNPGTGPEAVLPDGPADWSLGRLLSTAARLVEQAWNGWLAEQGITHAGLLALHALDDGPCTQRQLAAASRVEEQTMSRVVERLERTGHVERRRDPADRRRLIVSPTPRGRGVLTAIRRSDVADTLVAEHLTDPAAFRAELVRLVSAFPLPRPGEHRHD